MSKPATYIEDQSGVDLEASRTRLLFMALLSHGPGFSEKAEYRIGPTKCGRFDVLWVKSDWVDDDDVLALQAVSWLPRHEMKGRALPLALITAWLNAEKKVNGATTPNFDEVERRKTALLNATQVFEIVHAVFGK